MTDPQYEAHIKLCEAYEILDKEREEVKARYGTGREYSHLSETLHRILMARTDLTTQWSEEVHAI